MRWDSHVHGCTEHVWAELRGGCCCWECLHMSVACRSPHSAVVVARTRLRACVCANLRPSAAAGGTAPRGGGPTVVLAHADHVRVPVLDRPPQPHRPKRRVSLHPGQQLPPTHTCSTVRAPLRTPLPRPPAPLAARREAPSHTHATCWALAALRSWCLCVDRFSPQRACVVLCEEMHPGELRVGGPASMVTFTQWWCWVRFACACVC
jgi:hypothetical protein